MGHRKQKVLVGVAAILGVLILAGLLVWAEQSWSTTQAEMIASTQAAAGSSSARSTAHGSDAAKNHGDSSGATTQNSHHANGQTNGDAATGDSSSGKQSNDANQMNDGVARDTQQYTNSTNVNDGKIAAQVELNWWDANEAGISATGGVTNLIGPGGTCTLTASRGSATVSTSTTSIANATTTSCARMTIPRNKLSVGSWQIRLSYTSSQASGTSTEATVDVD
ncbi:hypothetical protein [Bifidobacterium aquikefiricola]|uniref:Secreted protein n=1 Tax=Bifidobacterium aquikefiricola TaxID=3059038 RepID=A0AB39U6I0_9BIFI